MTQQVKYTTQESIDIYNEINSSNLVPDLRSRLIDTLVRVDSLIKGGNYSEFEKISTYVKWILSIPFGTFIQDNLDLYNAKSELDKHHFGLEDVKNKILEYLAVIKLNQMNYEKNLNSLQAGSGDMKQLKGSSANAPVMLFIGIQGVGKTSMAKSFANALGREFVRIPLGGMANVGELKGISRNQSDAQPGQVIKALVNTKTMNPIILFDELDKVSATGGVNMDIMAALLEVLDPEQNSTFLDRYVDYPVDISKCLFIATANNLGGVTSALLDRMEIVRFTSYSDDDKQNIARTYLLPKIRSATGLSEEQLVFSDDVWEVIIRPLGFDAGIRELERTLTNIARKVAKKIVDGDGDKFVVSPDNFREYIPDDFGVYT